MICAKQNKTNKKTISLNDDSITMRHQTATEIQKKKTPTHMHVHPHTIGVHVCGCLYVCKLLIKCVHAKHVVLSKAAPNDDSSMLTWCN